jgi:RNA polymerase sigma-70 factor, ECF subfamily
MTPLLGHARTQRSFETLYHDHVSDVYRYALAVTGQPSDAEDVTQTTFLNAYRAYARGERPRKPQNWLLTIAHNVCRQRARFAYYRVREVELEEDAAEAFVPPEDVPTAADIRRALSHLPFQQRAVLIMRELEGRTHAEIADVMGLTTQATEMLAFRARRALREQLAGSLTCREAASALDRQMDGTLDADSAGLLRAHLRECEDCERLARRVRAQRVGWRALAVVPLPSSLATFNHAYAVATTGATVGGAGLGAGVVAKVAAVTIAAVTVGGGAYFVKRELPPLHAQPTHTAKSHVRHHRTTTHSSAVAAASTSWQAAPTAGTISVPVRHKSAKAAVKKGKKHEDVPVMTVPAVPTGASSPPPQEPVDQTTASTDQPVQSDDQSAAPADQTTVQADQQPQPGDPSQTPPPTPDTPHPNNGVRSHGSPTPPATPNGNGPQGQSDATPPAYNK